MIAYIEGTLVKRAPDAVIALTGGIALDVQVSARVVERLPAASEPVRFWTHLAIRDDDWTLYGFLLLEEREMFRLLISVNGIGPRVALGMLSAADPGTIARFLRTGDERSLTGLPGIGKKSAARLVVELGQRVPDRLADVDELGGATATDTGASTELAEPLAILVALGLPAARAESALRSARRTDPELVEDVERWVKVALNRI